MHLPDPNFPPLITGHPVKAPDRALRTAIEKAANGSLGAGDLIWARAVDRLEMALILEPEVERSRCWEILFLGKVAFGNALGVLAPSETAVTYRWPSLIFVNGAEVGKATLTISDSETDGIPEWMVFALEAAIMPLKDTEERGNNPQITTLWDEDCHDITRTNLLEATASQLVHGLHLWGEEGFRRTHENYVGRLHEEKIFRVNYAGNPLEGTLIGLDEIGNAILKVDGETHILEAENVQVSSASLTQQVRT